MSKVEIYEPAMCCSSGVCGPGIDPQLMSLAAAIDTLRKTDVSVGRFNLSATPQAFMDNKVVNDEITKEGINTLPLTLVNGIIVKRKEYPTIKELSEWTGIHLESTKAFRPVNTGCCGGNTKC